MNRGRNILKKAAAVAMSSSMILAGGSNVWAAGSYQETARASLQTLTESVAGAFPLSPAVICSHPAHTPQLPPQLIL